MPRCLCPIFRPDFAQDQPADRPYDVDVSTRDLIIITQSCDLAQDPPDEVALCPIYATLDFERVNPKFAKKGEWDNVRKGRHAGLHLLQSPSGPDDARACLVVDFHRITSLPHGYLCRHSEQLGARWRLKSPFLEDYAQAFGRFYMRVALPVVVEAPR